MTLVTGSSFENNSAGSNGGAIYVYEGSYAKIDDTVFANNKAKENGGAIGVFNKSKAYISNCVFSDNTPDEIYKSDSSSKITITETSGNKSIPYPVNPLKVPSKNYEHKGDFTVMTIGTGGPSTVVGRSGPSTLVQYKGNYFLVDVGEGTTFRIEESGLSLGSIKNIFITHMHIDHTDGYIKFMIESWTQGRRDTNIFGVKGVKALHNIFTTVFPEDITYRFNKTKTMAGMYEKVNITELEGANTFAVDGVKISTLPTIHTAYNLAYRFDADGKSIVVSGDTSYSENLIKLSKDTDVLVVDVGQVVNKGYLGPGEIKRPPGKSPSGQPRFADPATYVPKEVEGKSHGALEDVAIMAAKANVKKLVLTHYPPFEVDLESTLEQFKLYYDGEVIFGQDLLEIKP